MVSRGIVQQAQTKTPAQPKGASTMWKYSVGPALSKNEVALAVAGFGQFPKHTLASRSSQNVQEGNPAQLMRKGGAGGLIL